MLIDTRCHQLWVNIDVNLCAQRMYRRAFAGVEHPDVRQGCVRYLSHKAAKGIDFADKMSLRRATNGTVAGKSRDRCTGCCNECNTYTDAGSCVRGFYTRMPTTNDNYIPVTHIYILPTQMVRIFNGCKGEVVK